MSKYLKIKLLIVFGISGLGAENFDLPTTENMIKESSTVISNLSTLNRETNEEVHSCNHNRDPIDVAIANQNIVNRSVNIRNTSGDIHIENSGLVGIKSVGMAIPTR